MDLRNRAGHSRLPIAIAGLGCAAPLAAFAGVVDSGRADATLVALFIGFVVFVAGASLGLVALARGRQPGRLSMRRAAGAESAFALGAIAYVVVAGTGHGFAALERAILVAVALLVVASIGLVVYAVVRRRRAAA